MYRVSSLQPFWQVSMLLQYKSLHPDIYFRVWVREKERLEKVNFHTVLVHAWTLAMACRSHIIQCLKFKKSHTELNTEKTTQPSRHRQRPRPLTSQSKNPIRNNHVWDFQVDKGQQAISNGENVVVNCSLRVGNINEKTNQAPSATQNLRIPTEKLHPQ